MRIHRFPPIGALLLVALAISVGPGAWASHDPNYTHDPAPVVYGDQDGEEKNPKCAWLGEQQGKIWNELKVDKAPPNGTYEDEGSPGGPGGLELTVSNSDGYVIDWSSNIGVDAFVVKGGSKGSNVYFYNPEATEDRRVHSPLNKNGKVPQISHISVCYDEEQQEGGGQQQEGGGQQQEGGGQQQEGGGQHERPQDDGGDQQDDGDREQRAGQEQGGQQEQGSRPEQGGRQNDSGQQESGSNDGSDAPSERTPRQESESDEGSDEDQEGEGDALGESESDDGIAEEDDDSGDDDSSEDDDDRDRLPFTGAPLVFLALIGLMLVLTGLVGRRELR